MESNTNKYGLWSRRGVLTMLVINNLTFKDAGLYTVRDRSEDYFTIARITLHIQGKKSG